LVENGSWSFAVTVNHPDIGWEDYADGWDVVLPDGSVVKPDRDDPFTRLLTHPHENEQPFTRSQSGILIPEEVTQVTVRAHDLVDGFGGQEVVVYLDQANGLNFEVIAPQAEETSFALGLTYLSPNGNRYIPAEIDLLETTPIEFAIPGVPIWIVGVEEGETLRWLTVTDDGNIQLIEILDGEVTSHSLQHQPTAGACQ
jgi:hypothetical protein